jgi:hypothetical protein
MPAGRGCVHGEQLEGAVDGRGQVRQCCPDDDVDWLLDHHLDHDLDPRRPHE